MSVDWTKYPPLPEPPVLPPYRDTPEREACYVELKEYESRFFGRFGCILNVILFFLFVGGMIWLASNVSVMKIFCFIIIAFAGALLLGFIILYIFTLPGKLKIMAKHGIYMWKMKHPDLVPEIGAVLASRPAFSEEAFLRLWPMEQYAETALKIMQLVDRYRCSSGKMLYPNDSPLFLFFGKERKRGKSKICFPPEDFYKNMEDEFHFPVEEWRNLDIDTVTLAEIVEHCLEADKISLSESATDVSDREDSKQ